jgi:hypothetical protein
MFRKVEMASNCPARVSSVTVMVEAMEESFNNMMDVFPNGGRIMRTANGRITRRRIIGFRHTQGLRGFDQRVIHRIETGAKILRLVDRIGQAQTHHSRGEGVQRDAQFGQHEIYVEQLHDDGNPAHEIDHRAADPNERGYSRNSHPGPQEAEHDAQGQRANGNRERGLESSHQQRKKILQVLIQVRLQCSRMARMWVGWMRVMEALMRSRRTGSSLRRTRQTSSMLGGWKDWARRAACMWDCAI